MLEVESSNVKAIGYDDAEAALYVDFKNGGRYRYDSVPKWIYEDLMKAESKGRYLAISIKTAFPGKRVSQA